MTVQKQKSLFTRHMFLIVSGVVVMCSLFIVGFGLSSFFNDTAYVDIFPGKNSLPVLVWRIFFYCAGMMLWQPLTGYLVERFGLSETKNNPAKPARYRIRLLILILLYEVIVVQNTIVQLVGVIF